MVGQKTGPLCFTALRREKRTREVDEHRRGNCLRLCLFVVCRIAPYFTSGRSRRILCTKHIVVWCQTDSKFCYSYKSNIGSETAIAIGGSNFQSGFALHIIDFTFNIWYTSVVTLIVSRNAQMNRWTDPFTNDRSTAGWNNCGEATIICLHHCRHACCWIRRMRQADSTPLIQWWIHVRRDCVRVARYRKCLPITYCWNNYRHTGIFYSK